MKRLMILISSLTLAASLVGCGKGTTSPAVCGHIAQNCCAGANACIDANTACTAVGTGMFCVPTGTGQCGKLNNLCCTTGAACTDANTACTNGVCVAACGKAGQACCTGGTCTDANTTCTGGSCILSGPCGKLNSACCTGNMCTDANTVCTSGVCLNAPPCGALGQACCAMGTACTDATAMCDMGTMMCVAKPAGANSGDPCTKNADCLNGPLTTQKATCVKVTGMPPNQFMWPMGYCSSPCRATKTDTNGVNTDCPGGNATCSDGDHTCRALCMVSTDCRTDYACFVVNLVAPLGCEPKTLSMCEPTKAGSCAPTCTPTAAPDGGVADGGVVPDGGAGDMAMPPCFNPTCVNVGDGTVGNCVPGCDPFRNMGCDPTATSASDCHASDVTGEGLCTGAAAQGTGAGSQCGNFYSDCPGGYGCLSGKCWKYCNDGNAAAQCTAGAKCTKFSMSTKVPTSVAGICSMSP